MENTLPSYVQDALEAAVRAAETFDSSQDQNLITRSILLAFYLHETQPDVNDPATQALLTRYVEEHGNPTESQTIKDLLPVVPQLAALLRSFTPVTTAPSSPQEQPPFRLTDCKFLEAGAKTKARNNIAAIHVLKQLQADDRLPTEAEKLALSRYVGWGGLKDAFDPPKDDTGWESIKSELQEILSEKEFEAIRHGILNQHYTDPDVIRAIWEGVRHLGFKGGKILEPGSGMLFYLGLQPADLRKKSQWAAVEADPTPAKITRYLYPDAEVYNLKFEDTDFPQGCFDLAIGNVPFGEFSVFDPTLSINERKADKQLGKKATKLRIHNYFIAKSVELVRPGGLIALITSTGSLTTAPEFLKWLDKRANLIGAIRLPSNTFKQSARTEVTTDVIILQRHGGSVEAKENKWHDLVPTSIISQHTGRPLLINEYFADNPDMVLGTLREDALKTGRVGVEAYPASTITLGDRIVQAFQCFPAGIMTDDSPVYTRRIPEDLQHLDPYSFAEHEGKLVQRLEYTLVDVSPTVTSRIRAFLKLRDALKYLLWLQRRDCSDDVLAAQQATLNRLYDAFVKEYGPVNKPYNVRIYGTDPSSYLVRSLEFWDGKTARKTDIFFRRTIHARTEVLRADSPEDALLISLNEMGRVDLPYMVNLLERDGEPDAQKDLALELNEQGLLYFDPKQATEPGGENWNAWVCADEYLSGDVRTKLHNATACKEGIYHTLPADWVLNTLDRNIAALELVQPKYLLPGGSGIVRAEVAKRLGEDQCDMTGTIEARLGAPFVPPEDIEQFIREVLDLPYYATVSASYQPLLAEWAVEASSFVKTGAAATKTWGTERRNAIKLVELCLNRQEPVVYDTHYDGSRTFNARATEAAKAKAQKIRDRFKKWIWEDVDRAERLTRKYNEIYNTFVDRKYNGQHLTFPGMSNVFQMRDYQKDGVWRIVQSPATLLAWEVGVGKTLPILAASQTLRRLGLAKKPLVSVLNATIEQIEETFRAMYPGANLLIPTKKDFEKENRRRLLTMMATCEWDAIVIPHSQFFSLQVGPEIQAQYLRAEIELYEKAIRETSSSKKDSDKKITKKLENMREKLKFKLKLITGSDRKDNVINFEETGIDALFLDESQIAKNLGIVTHMENVLGIPTTQSLRAKDTHMKVGWLLSENKKVVFATGTPISNTVAEMFTQQRFLGADTLESLGIETFDSWAGVFGDVVTAPEITPTGLYKVKSRFARFTNVPELMRLFLMFADVKTAEQAGIDRPNAERITVSTPPSPGQIEYMEYLAERAEMVSNRELEPYEENMLSLTTKGRKMSMDLRLVRRDAGNWADTKLNRVALNVWLIHQLTQEQRATQLVFADFSAPRSDGKFNAYHYLRDTLIALGVPPEEIAIIHEYDKPSARAQLFRDFNDGKVRIMLGSTQKLGTGVNAQRRLIALHHVDSAWRPSDMIQREGRILRFGAIAEHVWIVTYVTEGISGQAGFDAFMFQALETKAKFIHQMLSGANLGRVAEDIDPVSFSCAQIKAVATGDPRFMEKANLDAEVMRLNRLKEAHEDEIFQFQSELNRLRWRIEHDLPEKVANAQADYDMVQRYPTDGDSFKVSIEGVTYTDREAAGAKLKELGAAREELAMTLQADPERVVIGSFRGMRIVLSAHYEKVRGRKNTFRTEHSFTLRFPNQKISYLFQGETNLGLMHSMEHIGRYSVGKELRQAEAALQQAIDRREDLLKHQIPPFEHEQALLDALARQDQLNEELGLLQDQADGEGESDESTEAEPQPKVETETDSEDDEEPISQEDKEAAATVAALEKMTSAQVAEYDGVIEDWVLEAIRSMETPDWILSLVESVRQNEKFTAAA